MLRQQGRDLSLKQDQNTINYRNLYPYQKTVTDDDIKELELYGKTRSVEVTNLGRLSEESIERFYLDNLQKKSFQDRFIKACASFPLSERAQKRYDIEYGKTNFPEFQKLIATDLFSDLEKDIIAKLYLGDTNYKSFNILNDPMQYVRVVKPEMFIPSGTVVDVGCGNGQLIESLQKNLEINPKRLIGVDVSNSSGLLLDEAGIQYAIGTLPQVIETKSDLFKEKAQVLFLSYFIDRDIDQRSTFDAVCSVIQTEGYIILEGLFPVEPFDTTGAQYASKESLLTKGISVTDDISRIVDYFSEQSIELLNIVVAERLVFSIDSFEILPSIFLIFKKR
jgi:hypothetical protein